MRVFGPLGNEWAMWQLPMEIFDHVKEQIKVSESGKSQYKNRLAGHISESNHIEDPGGKLLNHIEATVREPLKIPQQIERIRQGLVGSESTNLNLDDLWVNYQKKHEFNPIHNHSGILSFVIWVQIPYVFEQEQALEFVENVGGVTRTACFEFIWPGGASTPLNTAVLPVGKGQEGTICVFPSHLHHTVYPFYTSDGIRISVAGNIRLEVNK